jgi:nitrogen fixation protein FixH
VIAVNMTMARFALSTFGGTVVDNSYVASQNYNRWLANSRRQAALGWTAQAERLGDGHIFIQPMAANRLDLDGMSVTAVSDHPLGVHARRTLTLSARGQGFVSAEQLPDTRWRIRIDMRRGADRSSVMVDLP